MEAKRTTVVLSKDDFRDFGHNAAILHEQGYSLPHEVVFLEDGDFQVTIIGEHDWDALDDMMES
jgi:hypothetical protein